MDGYNGTLRAQGAGYGGAVEDQRPVRHVARRRRARRRHRSPTSSSTSTRSRRLSTVAREKYGLAGAVQHGASTLPDEAFNNFPRTETAEIHLATNFQNMLYDHLPADAARRDLRVAAREREGRAQGERHRRAVLLQDAQEGARPVQARVLGS